MQHLYSNSWKHNMLYVLSPYVQILVPVLGEPFTMGNNILSDVAVQ